MKNIVALISLFLILANTSSASIEENPIPLIKNLGFNLTYTDSPTFELPDLKGKLHSINEYKGKWLVVAFWATWCGPCKLELPELELLYNRLKLKNFNLIGISADQGDVYIVQKFVSELKLTFPILHDMQGVASSQFQANALPTLYLVSPDLKLVGLASGARSWSSENIVKEFENLIKIKNVDVKFFEAAEKETQVEAPVLEIEQLPEIFVNDKVLLKVKIHWKGEPAKYLVNVPKITFPNEIKLNGDIASASSASANMAVLNYLYPLSFAKAGKFQLGPITMSFQSAAGGKEQFSRHLGIEVEVKERSWNTVFAASIAIFLFIFMIIFIVRQKKGKPSKLVETVKTDWENSVNSIKRLRLEGSKKEYTLELLRLSIKYQKEKKCETIKLEELLEKIRFAGFELSDSELDYYEKELKRSIEGESI